MTPAAIGIGGTLTAIGLGLLTVWLLIAVAREAKGWRRQDAERIARRRERRGHRQPPPHLTAPPRYGRTVPLGGAIAMAFVLMVGIVIFWAWTGGGVALPQILVGGAVVAAAFAWLALGARRLYRRRRQGGPPSTRSRLR